jgi:predicted TIM-barrel fold metal-dependent hydrolase
MQHPEGEREAHGRHQLVGWDPFSPDLKRDILAEDQLAGAILCPDQGMMASASSNPILGLELSLATNRWSVEQLDKIGDSRLRGVVVIPSHLPEEAAKELLAVGQDRRFAAVAMGANGLGKPFGHPVYHPIYRAAARVGLPVMIHVGGESPPDTLTHPTGGGTPNTFGGRYALRAQPVMTHLISLVAMGVLETVPDLRVVIVGAGVAWLPSFLWRFDNDYKAQGGIETPWLKRLPSEYIRNQVSVTTYALIGAGLPEPQLRALQTVPWIHEMISFASGYPGWDANHWSRVSADLPPEWRRKIMHDNAKANFRWQD